MNISIVVPCYNEVRNIRKLEAELIPVLSELSRTNSVEAIFIDDGSTDGTLDELYMVFHPGNQEGLNVQIVCHPVNRGLGAAMRTGFAAAHGEVIVTTDSDGTYRFSEIPALLNRLTPGVDLVTASPYHPYGGMQGVPGYRLILSRGASIIYRLLVDGHIHTYTSLFRAYRKELIQQVSFQSDGFLAGTELLVRAIFMGYRVNEYPAVLSVRKFGSSKARLARITLSHLRFQGRILMHRLKLLPLPAIQPSLEHV